MKAWIALIASGLPLGGFAAVPSPPPPILDSSVFQRYVEMFNRGDAELYRQAIPNSAASEWLQPNVPRFECPDKEIELTYCFRWWTYRKHIRQTPDGFVITEFLPNVAWAGKLNTISCAAGHHFYEGRWIADPQYLDDYAKFWFRKGGEPRRYSCWLADALLARHRVQPNLPLLADLLPDLVANYEAWEKERRDDNGLFWQIDDRDGMEVSVGGSGYRATINSYMFGDALAIAQIAKLVGRNELADRFDREAARIKSLVQEKLWDEQAAFFRVLPRGTNTTMVDVRELHGLTPWYFNLPDARFAVAWKQLMDPEGFFAPFGPTTAEQRCPGFKVAYAGHECQWNGPSWPYATSVTLVGLANLLNGPEQSAIAPSNYCTLLHNYALSHRLRDKDGTVLPWIDENLNPFTGDWIARALLKQRGEKIPERGKDYNHSTFCDLVISGLVGVRPRSDNTIEVNPLAPQTWDYLCLDRVYYRGQWLTILWDKTGTRYGKGKGLWILVNGQEIGSAPGLQRLAAEMPQTAAAEPQLPSTTAAELTLSINCSEVRHVMRGGIGASWHAIETPIPVVNRRSHGGSGWGGYPTAEDDAAWRQIYQHADWLGLDFCRVELEQRIYEPERRQFTWDSPEMRILYRILDWCERRHVDVFLQQMWGNVDWNAWPEFRGDPVERVHSGPYSLDEFAEGLAGLMDHLVNSRHYTCIRWLCINNEPGYDWSWWQRPPNEPMSLRDGLAAVRQCLDRKGISVPLSGPDKTDLPELKPAEIDFDPFIGAYDLHSYYARFDWQATNGYPLSIAEQRLGDWAKWAHERGKPLFLSELGTMSFGWNGNHPGPSTFEAAIKDAELVVRGLNLGVDGFNRWSLINRGDLDGHWEMISTWDEQNHTLLKEITPKPNSYFVYGLISRLTAKHSSVLACEQTGGHIAGLNRVFAAALRSPRGNLSLVIVNDAPRPWRAHLGIKSAPKRLLYQYRVTAADRDQPGLRVNPAGEVSLEKESFETTLPPMSLTIFSSFHLTDTAPGVMEE